VKDLETFVEPSANPKYPLKCVCFGDGSCCSCLCLYNCRTRASWSFISHSALTTRHLLCVISNCMMFSTGQTVACMELSALLVCSWWWV